MAGLSGIVNSSRLKKSSCLLAITVLNFQKKKRKMQEKKMVYSNNFVNCNSYVLK